jgi:hypothetical protein
MKYPCTDQEYGGMMTDNSGPEPSNGMTGTGEEIMAMRSGETGIIIQIVEMVTICRFAGTEMIILLLTGEIIMIASKATITLIAEEPNVVMYLTGQMISRLITTGIIILKDAEILLTGTTIMISRLIMTEG